MQIMDIFGGDRDAVAYPIMPAGIVAAAVRAEVQQAAGRIGQGKLAGFLVLDTDLAAQAAAVAQGFPFRRRHLVQILAAPERSGLIRRPLRLSPARAHRKSRTDLAAMEDAHFDASMGGR
jgi:hypothetical protein